MYVQEEMRFFETLVCTVKCMCLVSTVIKCQFSISTDSLLLDLDEEASIAAKYMYVGSSASLR